MDSAINLLFSMVILLTLLGVLVIYTRGSENRKGNGVYVFPISCMHFTECRAKDRRES